MKDINNINKIKNFIVFNSGGEGWFYRIEVIVRKKDLNFSAFPDVKSGKIKTYIIDSISKFEASIPEIIIMCNAFNARAYIDLTPKLYKKVFKQTLTAMCERNESSQYPNVSRVFNSIAAKNRGAKGSKYVMVDVDDINISDSVEMIIFNQMQVKAALKIPSRKGCHLIYEPFNSTRFKEWCDHPDAEFKKDAFTNLFIPGCRKSK
jgi:hypothetical protein